MNLSTRILIALLLFSGFATLKSQATEQHSSGKANCTERKGERPSQETRAQLRSDLKAYHQEVIRPERLAAREALDQEISKKDRKEMERIRAVMATRPLPERGERPDSREAHQEKRAIFKEDLKSWRTKNAPTLAALTAMSEKYASAIDAQLAQLKAKHEDWKAGKREIVTEHLGEVRKRGHRRHHARKPHGKRGHHQGDEHEQMHLEKARVKFLLLGAGIDESGALNEANSQFAAPSLLVSPNPMVGSGTINLKVAEETRLLIQLFNENGQVVRSLGRKKFVGGNHQLPLDVSGLPAGAYRLNASGKAINTSTPLIINQ